MTSELYGLVLLAVVCLVISPLYKQTRLIEKPFTIKKKNVELYKYDSVNSGTSKSIVFLSDTFLPKTFAGSELSGYETLKYLRTRGHTATLFLKTVVVKEYDGFPIYKFNTEDPFCQNTILNADIIFFQMGNETKNIKVIQHRTKPTFVFIHVVNSYDWLLQQKMAFPITVVYNSMMTQNLIPTFHDNMRMIPYVNTDKFKSLRDKTVQNKVVVLINCNPNKGGQIFKDLAYKLPKVQFMGVKGGYSNQIIDESPPPNLTYIENQTDITVVFKKAGILVMPSKNETWGRTAVEAMSSGVPVIHSESAGLVECVGGAGILCMHDDIDAWADAINRILNDNAYRERLRQNGFNRIEEIEVEQRRGRQELAMKIEGL